jgi:hypothetical protein
LEAARRSVEGSSMRIAVVIMGLLLVSGVGRAWADGPATKPAKVLEGIEAALKMVPAGVLPSRPEEWTVAKRDVANSAFDQKVKGQRLKIHIKVSGIGKDGEDYVVAAEMVQTPIFNAAIDLHFTKDNALDVARLTVGDEITVVGQVSVMSFDDQSPTPELGCVMLDSGIVREHAGR